MTQFLDPSLLPKICLEDIRKSKKKLDATPIPVSVDLITMEPYRQIPAKRQIDCCELVDVLKNYSFKGSSLFAHDVGLHPVLKGNLQSAERSIFLRKDMIPSLEDANTMLAPYGYELFLHDGYRRAACQAEIRKRVERYWYEKGESFLSAEGLREFCEKNANKTASTAEREPVRNDPTTWFAHCTGASINVTLIHRSGAPAEMGSMLVDLSGLQQTNYYEVHSPRSLREEMARTNRRLLFWSLTLSGWFNSPLLYCSFHYCQEKTTQYGIQSALAWNFADVAVPTHASIGPAVPA
jgi:D-alanyl-D-alanine dipeptidase